jgi:prevent-host-death family protein
MERSNPIAQKNGITKFQSDLSDEEALVKRFAGICRLTQEVCASKMLTMKIATVREAQHHLSKLLNEVEMGEEIILTRRGKQIARLVPPEKAEDPRNRKIDWATWAAQQHEFLASMPMLKESAVTKEREDYRW